MKRNKLLCELSAIGVNESSYSLGEIRGGDCVCVVSENTGWKAYYVERDKPVELAVLDSEEEAYDFVYVTFCKWLGINTVV
ncbi:hypothetical protein OH710_11905 [Pseudomonas capsici]|uniref:hypothetical protein n=1 Tax=Pseudomonas capsici TaxID=2810614 RepID=UPI0021F1BD82|nr:hypothetical protein [Pseudomonas capsici]MCV4273348.1 hypothetical protein [Pseudomonas capsici]